MRLIVADANIFALLHQVGLLNVLFSNQWLEVYVTQEVFDELTNNTRRIAREYPELPDLVRKAVFTAPQDPKDGINVIEIDSYELSIESLAVYYILDEQAVLDRGEIESIPLAIHLSATFVSSDEDAITTMNEFANDNVSAATLEEFVNELFEQRIISKEDLKKALDTLKL